MPFGMVNSFATFVSVIRKPLHDVDNVETYIDDIIVHTRDWQSHLKTLSCLFKRFCDAGVTAKPSTCVIGAQSVEFLGHNDIMLA